MLEQPKAGLISRFYRQVENRLKKKEKKEKSKLVAQCAVVLLAVVI